MNTLTDATQRITPDLVRRTGGGWLAISPKDAIFTLGVTASTEDQAREKFRTVFHRWIEILESAPKSEST